MDAGGCSVAGWRLLSAAGHVTVQRQARARPGRQRLEAGSRDAALDQPAAGDTTHYTRDIIRAENEDPRSLMFHKLGPHGQRS